MNRHQLAIAHGAFDVVTGAWPLLSLKTFEAITGPKPEGWLVKTTGTLIAGIGSVLALAGIRKRVTPEITTLAIVTSAGLTAIDLYYAGLRRRISPVYLLDAIVELGIIGAWACAANSDVVAPAASDDVVRGVW
jgi:hypothetical protein